jgi:uncharacterized damage-inducible protein DinB
MNDSENLLVEFDEEFATTRKFLDRVPEEKWMWKPHEKSMELGRLAWHVADFPQWCRDTFKQDFMELKAEDGEKARHEWEGKKRADLLEKFDRDLADARAMVARASHDDMERPWKMEWGGQVIIDSPRGQVYRKWVMNHLVHHRAQLGVYLRLNGVAIPGSYGPSADEESGG